MTALTRSQLDAWMTRHGLDPELRRTDGATPIVLHVGEDDSVYATVTMVVLTDDSQAIWCEETGDFLNQKIVLPFDPDPEIT